MLPLAFVDTVSFVISEPLLIVRLLVSVITSRFLTSVPITTSLDVLTSILSIIAPLSFSLSLMTAPFSLITTFPSMWLAVYLSNSTATGSFLYDFLI